MSKANWLVLLASLLQFWSTTCEADWQVLKGKWLEQPYYTLFHPSNDGTAGFFLTTQNIESIELKLMLKKSSLVLADKEPPFILKGDVYFDGKKYANYQLKSGLDIHRFKGVEYEFPKDILDADFYEKIKSSKTLSFHYQGLKNKAFQVDISLDDYYIKFNQFVTFRMKEFVPEFLSRPQKKKYLKMVDSCISRAENMMLDLEAKNRGVSLEERKKQVVKNSGQQLSVANKEKLAGRVVSAYYFSGDSSKPEWLLYPLFSDCYNREIHQFN